MPWTTTVDALPKSPESDAIIAGLQAAGGWGTGSFRTDRSLEVLQADASTPMRTFTPTSDFYQGECDHVPFPVPVGGALEGESGYSCDGDGDCHLIVIDATRTKLYEMWRANIQGGTFYGGCAAVWDLTKQYGPTLRGKGCTSADAAGFPIAAMLANADEVFAGEVKHALRYILPNSRIQRGMYVAPATHSTPATSGGSTLPPYGTRLRLKASTNISGFSKGAQVIAKALQVYGMFLADGGNVPLTLQSDRFTQHKWSEVGITDDSSLGSLRVTDFEVVEFGTRVNYLADDTCVRNP
jgi:serine/threonine-protein kinase